MNTNYSCTANSYIFEIYPSGIVKKSKIKTWKQAVDKIIQKHYPKLNQSDRRLVYQMLDFLLYHNNNIHKA